MASRPNLDARPARTIAAAVNDMFAGDIPQAVDTVKPSAVDTAKPRTVNTAKPPAAEPEPAAAGDPREKTSFAIRASTKRHLALLKIDLRREGVRVSESEIVEALVSQSTLESVRISLRPR